jgi:type IV fimbrial biogenesis protein FimT
MEKVANMIARARLQHGFTIIEILLVIVIMGIMATIAAPSFVTFTSGQKVKTASFDVYAALMFARSEAIKRRQCVTVAPASTTDWNQGWTVSLGGTSAGCAAVSTLLRTQDSLSGVLIPIPPGAAEIVYRLDGRLTSIAATGVLVQPQIADASIANRCIRVDLTGLPKSTNTTATTCP